MPDVIGYHDSCGLFMVELKLARGPRVVFSPHQILWHQTHTKRNFILVGQAEKASSRSVKLYQSSAVLGLINDHRETPCLSLDDWAPTSKEYCLTLRLARRLARRFDA